MGIEVAPDLVEALGHVEIPGRTVLEEHLPHAREVADDVADAGEDHPIHTIQAAVEAHLDRAAWDVADVALVVGVPRG